jgi:hypothetical protein
VHESLGRKDGLPTNHKDVIEGYWLEHEATGEWSNAESLSSQTTSYSVACSLTCACQAATTTSAMAATSKS